MNEQRWEEKFESQTGMALPALLSPIEGSCAVGEDLRSQPVYRELKRAREYDEPSLPMGEWDRELKRADWPAVQRLCVRELGERSKDLQLGVWLLEAHLHLYGFAGLAPVVHLMTRLCDEHWAHMYPSIEDGDMEHRTNVLLAANKLLVPALRTLPLVQVDDQPLSWSQYLVAQRIEHQRAAGGEVGEDGLQLEDYRRLLARSPVQALAVVQRDVLDALASLQCLRETIIRVCEDDPPSLGPVVDVLTEISHFLAGELQQRGHSPEQAGEAPSAAAPEPAAAGNRASGGWATDVEQAPVPAGAPRPCDPAHERASAYAALDQLADVLMRVDPHSPTPYLIKRAVHWGALSTAELYQEIFVRCEGRLSVFELMGIEGKSQ